MRAKVSQIGNSGSQYGARLCRACAEIGVRGKQVPAAGRKEESPVNTTKERS